MPSAADSLLEAATRTSGRENRLTEIFAAALQLVPALAAALMDASKLPPGDAYEVSTQFGVAGNILDLEVLALGTDGIVRGRLWVENKIDHEFRERQLEDYADRLSQPRWTGEKCLLAIVPERRAAPSLPATGIRAAAMTWQDIAVLASKVGAAEGGRYWREAAGGDKWTVRQHILDELILYLENEELAYMDAITSAHVLTLELADETRQALQTLMDRALQGLVTHSAASGTGKGGTGGRRQFGFSWRHLEQTGTWPETGFGGWPEVLTHSEDYWNPDDIAMESGAFAAGFTFDPAAAAPLLSDEAAPWREQLRVKGLIIDHPDDYVRCVGTLYLSQVVTGGQTLDDQARFVAEWIDNTISAIIDSPPPT